MGMKSLYLGPTYDLSDIEGLDTSYEQVANLISNRNIVAIFQGRSEAGPRALGNRSILYDPRDPDGKDHVNTIKKREAFRPFAGTILKEYVHDWFDMAGLEESPFMMYAADAHPNIRERIPAILHVDQTCRIQTLTREQNEHYYNLIDAFYKQTNVPILFNTSFNLAGEPLVETPEDALKTFNDSEIKYLYFPEIQKLISK
jgi:carbamoyltransferase